MIPTLARFRNTKWGHFSWSSETRRWNNQNNTMLSLQSGSQRWCTYSRSSRASGSWPLQYIQCGGAGPWMNTAIIIRCFVYRALLRNAEMFKTKTVGTALSLYVWVLKLCSLLVVFAFTHLFHLLALCAFVYCCCFLVHCMWLQCLRLWKKETTWV